MSIRPIVLTLAIGCVGLSFAVAEPLTPLEKITNAGGGFVCTNGIGVGCIGTIAIMPVSVHVKEVRVLNDNELTTLSNSLNYVAILDGGVLDHNIILNDVEDAVLDDFLYTFDIDVSDNDVNVCTSILGIQLCK